MPQPNDIPVPLASIAALFGGLPGATFGERLNAFGAPPSENVEDRRGDPQSGYEHMLAFNNLSGAAYRHLFPWLRALDMHVPQAHHSPLQAGQLREQAGYYDIGRAPSVPLASLSQQ